MNKQQVFIVDLAYGPYDGETLVAEDATGELWTLDESTFNAKSVFLQTDGGAVGSEFILPIGEHCKYPIYKFADSAKCRYLVCYDYSQCRNHRYKVVDRIAVGHEILIRAEFVATVISQNKIVASSYSVLKAIA